MTPQQRMKSKLESLGIPYKRIECYGSQIVVTAYSRGAADQWADTLGRFATVRGVVESHDEAERNRNTVLKPSLVSVVNVFARV